MLSAKLCTLSGEFLASLDNRLPGMQVKVGIMNTKTASVSLSFDDEAAAQAYPLFTTLKVALDDWPLFSGVVLKPKFDLAVRRVAIPAIDVSFRAATRFIGDRSDGAGLNGHVAGNPYRWEGVDQSQMMWRFIQYMQRTAAEATLGIPDHGIGLGNLAGPTQFRDREYEYGKQILEAMNQLAGVINGVEYDFRAVDQEDGILALLDTFHPRMGFDKTDSVIFEAGWGAENCSDFSWEPSGDGVINRAVQIGQAQEGEPSPVRRADQIESQLGIGIYSQVTGRSDISEPNTLAEHAQGVASTYGWPIDYFDLIPATQDGSGWEKTGVNQYERIVGKKFGIPPRFGPGPHHDCWIGDTIRAIARDKPALDVDLTGRITDATITEADAEGNVAYELTCAPTISATGVVVT